MSQREFRTSYDLLLVEDNPSDVRLCQEALQQSTGQYTLHVVPDGTEALAFLGKTGAYAHAPTPDLILLDLNLPQTDGREVLAVIKADATLKHIPVIIFTNSQAAADIERAYALHANFYITKPTGLEAFLTAVRIIEQFWGTVAVLPLQTGKRPLRR
jgi:CheY-like chemotaxis protein